MSNYNICLKTEVAVECAAGVRAFIVRNYDYQGKPYPEDIAEIYKRNSEYHQSLYTVQTEEELDRIMDKIKSDREYVESHTPKPHR